MTCDTETPTRVFIGLALAVVVAWPGAAWAQEGELQFFFSVRDASGEPVTDLTPEDFNITQNGIACDVVSAELVATRLQLALVLDDGVSMRGYQNHMVNGMPRFLDALPEGSDVSLIFMADRPTILQDFTTDGALVKEKFEEDYFPKTGSGTAFLDTLERVVDNLMKEDGEDGVPEGGTLWPVIAIIGSDGNDVSRGNPQRQIDDLSEKISGLGATLHFLMLENTGQGMMHQMAEFFTSSTGGWTDRVAGPSQLAEDKLAEFGAVIAERYAVRANQYRVRFKPFVAESTAGFSGAVNRPGVAVQITMDGRLQ